MVLAADTVEYNREVRLKQYLVDLDGLPATWTLNVRPRPGDDDFLFHCGLLRGLCGNSNLLVRAEVFNLLLGRFFCFVNNDSMNTALKKTLLKNRQLVDPFVCDPIHWPLRAFDFSSTGSEVGPDTITLVFGYAQANPERNLFVRIRKGNFGHNVDGDGRNPYGFLLLLTVNVTADKKDNADHRKSEQDTAK